MLLSILPYNNNKVFFMYTSVSCVLIVFYDVSASSSAFMWHIVLFTLGPLFWTEVPATKLT